MVKAKAIILPLILSSTVAISSFSHPEKFKAEIPKELANMNFYQPQAFKDAKNYFLEQQRLRQQEELKLKEKEEEKSYYFEDIELPKELQKYIFDLSNEKNLPYTLVLGVAYQESRFDVNIEESDTHDVGLFQINKTNLDPKKKNNFAIMAGIKNVNPNNPYHSSKMAIYHLSNLWNYWSKRTNNKNAVVATLLSYNRGTSNAGDYIANKGYSPDDYVRNILNKKKELDSKL